MVTDFMESSRRVEVSPVPVVLCPYIDQNTIQFWPEKKPIPTGPETRFVEIRLRGYIVHPLAAEVRYGICSGCRTFYYTPGPDRGGVIASFYPLSLYP